MSFARTTIERALRAAAALVPRPPVVDVTEDDAQAAVRSERLLRRGGEPVPGFAPLSRLWPAADGWVRTHANYPWHRTALLRALGLEAAGATARDATGGDDDAVAAAIGALPAAEVERRAFAAGGLAVAARDAAAWRAETGLEAPELVAAARIGDAPPRAPRQAPTAGAPLAGVRVLDLTRVIAGPTATRYLGALGAEVLRVDDPRRPELELHRLDGLIDKRSALLDLGDMAALHALLDGADVVVLGARPGALDRFGLEPRRLAVRHPGLVMVTLSAWGDAAGWQGRRGFDSLVQVASGIATSLADADGRPGALPCQLLDHATGCLMAAAACEALREQRETGGSHHASLALAHTTHHLLAASPIEDVAPRARTATFGPLEVVQPPGALDGRSLTWARPPAGYGADVARW